MPTYIKTGFWDKIIGNNPQQAKAPKGWLNLDYFVQTLIPPTPPGTNIYNSDGTLTGTRILNATGYDLSFLEIQTLKFSNYPLDYGYYQDAATIKLGDYAYNYLSGLFFEIDGNNGIIKTAINNNDIGLKLDFANTTYQLGQITGNNATTLKIDDAAAFPVQVSGTNVTQNTSGVASGKFLKIKVDGVDYVIELKNPS